MKNKIVIVLATLFLLIFFFSIMYYSYNNNGTLLPKNELPDNMEDNNMSEFVSKINIIVNGVNYTATLEDNETAREFIRMLPLEITMNELNGNEKYYYFNDSLSSNSSSVGDIHNGDLMLYGRDCLVLFYESFNTSYSYTRIGKIDNPSSLKNNLGNGNVKVLFQINGGDYNE